MKNFVLLLTTAFYIFLPAQGIAQDITAVKSVADLRTNAYQNTGGLKKSANDKLMINLLGYYLSNDGGGGQFYFDDTATVADNGGTIIKPIAVTGAGRWKRVFDRAVNVLWFGAKRDNTTDASTAINAAIVAAPAIRTTGTPGGLGYGIVYIPSGSYKMSHPIIIRTTIALIGEESGMWPYQETRLNYDGNIAGIDIRASKNGYGGRSVRVKNLYLRNYGAATDSTKHGFFTNARVELDNVAVENFGGDGFRIYTVDSGNANNSILKNITAFYNAKSGIHLQGVESNNIGIYSSSFNTNGMCGVLDCSFLGNMYYNCHVSFNGIRVASTYSKSWARHGGKIFQAIKYPNQKGIEPQVTTGWENYWFENPSVFGDNPNSVVPWSKDSTYWITAAYAVVNTAPTSSFFGCYSEGGEGASILNEYSICWGGDHGAGFAYKRNLYLHPYASQLIVDGAGIKVYDRDSTKTFTSLDHSLGLQVNSEKYGHTGGQIKYFESDYSTKWYHGNSVANLAFETLGRYHDASRFGLSALTRPGYLSFPYDGGFFMGDLSDPARSRRFLAASKRPSAGEHAAGEWCKDISANVDTIGWLCTVAGTPGTWVGILSANNVSGAKAGTGTINTAAANKLAFYASNGTAISGAKGINWDETTLNNQASAGTTAFKLTSQSGAYNINWTFDNAAISRWNTAGVYQFWQNNNSLFECLDNSVEVNSSNRNINFIVHGDNDANAIYMKASNDNTGFGTGKPDVSAKVEIASTAKGFLPPRMTTKQRDAIGSPAEGLMIYNTTTKTLNFYNGTSWKAVRTD